MYYSRKRLLFFSLRSAPSPIALVDPKLMGLGQEMLGHIWDFHPFLASGLGGTWWKICPAGKHLRKLHETASRKTPSKAG